MTQTATAATIPAAQAPGSYDLSKSDTILVKFHFTNQDHVPRGIPSLDRSGSFALDYHHYRQAKEAGKAELGKIGRHRDNRVDTGEPVIDNLPAVQATLLKEDLLKAGFALKQVHWLLQKRAEHKPKYVVVCEFVRGRQTQELPEEVLEALDYLSHTSRWFCHVWDNSALEKPTTINFVGRQPHIAAQYYLMVVGDKIEPIPVKK